MATKESNIINYALAALGLYLVFKKQPLLQTGTGIESGGGGGNNIVAPVKDILAPVKVAPDVPVKEIKTPNLPITDLIKTPALPIFDTPIYEDVPLPVKKVVVTPVTTVKEIATPVRAIKTQVEPAETIKTIDTPITDLIIAIKTQVEPAVIRYKYQDPNYNRYADDRYLDDLYFNDIFTPVKEVIAIKTQVEPAVEQIYVPIFDIPIYTTPIDIAPIYVPPFIEEIYVPIFDTPIYTTIIDTTPIDVVPPPPETYAPLYSGGTSSGSTAPESNFISEYTGGYGSGGEDFWNSLFNTQWTDNIADPTSFDTASAYNSDQA